MDVVRSKIAQFLFNASSFELTTEWKRRDTQRRKQKVAYQYCPVVCVAATLLEKSFDLSFVNGSFA